jgi:hypothetical protein
MVVIVTGCELGVAGSESFGLQLITYNSTPLRYFDYTLPNLFLIPETEKWNYSIQLEIHAFVF